MPASDTGIIQNDSFKVICFFNNTVINVENELTVVDIFPAPMTE